MAPIERSASIMGCFAIEGTVTSWGSGVIHPGGTLYEWVELVRADGQRCIAGHVFVGHAVESAFFEEAPATFCFDQMSLFLPPRTTKQLFGVRRQEGLCAFDAVSLRPTYAFATIKLGAVLLIFGVGLIPLIAGISQVFREGGISQERRRMFYGDDPIVAEAIRRQEPIRI
jgi:hypothetical protein